MPPLLSPTPCSQGHHVSVPSCRLLVPTAMAQLQPPTPQAALPSPRVPCWYFSLQTEMLSFHPHDAPSQALFHPSPSFLQNNTTRFILWLSFHPSSDPEVPLATCHPPASPGSGAQSGLQSSSRNPGCHPSQLHPFHLYFAIKSCRFCL